MKLYVRADTKKITSDDVYRALKRYEGKYKNRNNRTFDCKLNLNTGEFTGRRGFGKNRRGLDGLIEVPTDSIKLKMVDRQGHSWGSVSVYLADIPQEYLEEYLEEYASEDHLMIIMWESGGVKSFHANTIDEMLKYVDIAFKFEFKGFKRI